MLRVHFLRMNSLKQRSYLFLERRASRINYLCLSPRTSKKKKKSWVKFRTTFAVPRSNLQPCALLQKRAQYLGFSFLISWLFHETFPPPGWHASSSVRREREREIHCIYIIHLFLFFVDETLLPPSYSECGPGSIIFKHGQNFFFAFWRYVQNKAVHIWQSFPKLPKRYSRYVNKQNFPLSLATPRPFPTPPPRCLNFFPRRWAGGEPTSGLLLSPTPFFARAKYVSRRLPPACV